MRHIVFVKVHLFSEPLSTYKKYTLGFMKKNIDPSDDSIEVSTSSLLTGHFFIFIPVNSLACVFETHRAG